mmetsp:Transcript_74098/g.230413  ORF Transcript_74098/g.230413 Transcript_74098/m.230413 type:complete len:188 (+) Transcript_74098:691-1254(+)
MPMSGISGNGGNGGGGGGGGGAAPSRATPRVAGQAQGPGGDRWQWASGAESPERSPRPASAGSWAQGGAGRGRADRAVAWADQPELHGRRRDAEGQKGTPQSESGECSSPDVMGATQQLEYEVREFCRTLGGPVSAAGAKGTATTPRGAGVAAPRGGTGGAGASAAAPRGAAAWQSGAASVRARPAA